MGEGWDDMSAAEKLQYLRGQGESLADRASETLKRVQRMREETFIIGGIIALADRILAANPDDEAEQERATRVMDVALYEIRTAEDRFNKTRETLPEYWNYVK